MSIYNNRNFEYFQVLRWSKSCVFQYVQVLRWSILCVFQYFQGLRWSEWLVFQYFQDPRFPIQADTLFPDYKNKNEDEWLIITGVGKLNATSGASYLYSLCPHARTSFWINFGIAGAGKKVGNIGDIFFINELRNYDHDKVYYPFICVWIITYNTPRI